MLYQGEHLVLERDRIRDAGWERRLDELPDPRPRHPARLTGTTPLMERLWRIALQDIESAAVDSESRPCFGSNDVRGERISTRDVSFAGVLGVTLLYPGLLQSSLELTRERRDALGFRVASGHELPEIPVEWTVEAVGERAFAARHGAHSYTRCTDDVIWLWPAGLLAEENQGLEYWWWIYGMGTRCFERFYDPFQDPADSLFCGQPCVGTPVDTASRGHDLSGGADWKACVLSKALSTNCLYWRAMQTMVIACEEVGRDDDADRWEKRARELRAAIRSEFQRPDGSLASGKNRLGLQAEERDAMGTALAVLFEILPRDEARAAVANYPAGESGVPPVYPAPDTSKAPPARTDDVRPLAATCFLKALEKVDGCDRTDLNAALLARVLGDTGGTRPTGNRLRNGAAFVDVCRRAGLVEIG